MICAHFSPSNFERLLALKKDNDKFSVFDRNPRRRFFFPIIYSFVESLAKFFFYLKKLVGQVSIDRVHILKIVLNQNKKWNRSLGVVIFRKQCILKFKMYLQVIRELKGWLANSNFCPERFLLFISLHSKIYNHEFKKVTSNVSHRNFFQNKISDQILLLLYKFLKKTDYNCEVGEFFS